MKNIGLFGGTFDPIHNGHLHIARAFADEIGLDTVVFLPAGDPYHKDPSRAPVQIFRQQFPAAQLWWLMGSDSLMKLHTWKKWQTLVRQTHIAVAMRQGDNLNQTPRELHAWLGEALQNGSVRILNAPLHNTSSTQIRQTLQSGRLSDDLPPQVARYIREHKLYQSGK